MVEQREIETKWGIHKLLITGVKNKNMLAFKLGQFDIYLQSLEVLIPDTDGESWWKTPVVAVVRTPNRNNVYAFIKEMTEFKAYKIFKHGVNMPRERLRGFACNNVMNMMGLRPDSMFYIKCEDVEIRNLFYTESIRLADQHEFDCDFDFDDYDYALEIRVYERLSGNLAVVTIMSGPDMPNDYRTSEYNLYRYRWPTGEEEEE